MVKTPANSVRLTRGRRPDTVPDTLEGPHAPGGYTWAALVDHLVGAHGSLARVAELLAESRGYRDDAASIERALRRLRARADKPGGVWGTRVLERFGLPDEPTSRARWMGSYHSRFTDLPVDACESLLRMWDSGPVRESRARAWIELGFASVALRRRALDAADEHLASARLVLARAHPAALVEWALTAAFVASRRASPDQVTSALALAGDALERHAHEIEPDELACLHARWVDQRAFDLNRTRNAEREREAMALYASLEARDAPPFARSRRENGLAYAHMRLGARRAAREHAERAARAAGDAGALRLRAMALLMIVKIDGAIAAQDELDRARTIARALGDDELLARVERAR